VKPKLKPKPKLVPTTPSLLPIPRLGLRSRFGETSSCHRPNSGSSNAGDRFLAAGRPSPFYDLSEVPESLRAFVGMPDPPPDISEWEAEQAAIENSFGGQINESIAEELSRKQTEEIEGARARNAISLAQADREDEFVRSVQAEHDAETELLYQEQEQKQRQPKSTIKRKGKP